VGYVEIIHKCEDLGCVAEKFLSMERALLRAGEYAVLVNLHGGRAFCTYVSLARRGGIEEYEPPVWCDPLATIAIYGKDGDSELLVLDGSCVDLLPDAVSKLVQLVVERFGVPFNVEFFRLDGDPFTYVRIGDDIYQSYHVVLKKTPQGVTVLYPFPVSRVYVSGVTSPQTLHPELVDAVEELRSTREEVLRLEGEIEQEIPKCTNPELRIRAEELLTLYYSLESAYMDMMTGYRVYHAPALDELGSTRALETLKTLQEEYKRFVKEATPLLEELKKCKD
jgi:hypothetical protein